MLDCDDLALRCSHTCVQLFEALEGTPREGGITWRNGVAELYDQCEGWRLSVDNARVESCDEAVCITVEAAFGRLDAALGYVYELFGFGTNASVLHREKHQTVLQAESDTTSQSELSDTYVTHNSSLLDRYWRKALSEMEQLRQQLFWLPKLPLQPVSTMIPGQLPSADQGDSLFTICAAAVDLYVKSQRLLKSSGSRPSRVVLLGLEERIADAALLARLARAMERRRKRVIQLTTELSWPDKQTRSLPLTRTTVKRLAYDSNGMAAVPAEFNGWLSNNDCELCTKENRRSRWRKKPRSRAAQSSSLALADEDWRNHLLEHLRPFVCTYGRCTSATQLYPTVDAWIHHETHVEQLQWTCPDCPLEQKATFPIKEDFQAHLQSLHAGELTKAHMGLMVRYARQVQADERSRCPICFLPTIELGSSLRDHVAKHLTQLATLSLYDHTQLELGEEMLLEPELGYRIAPSAANRDDRSSIAAEAPARGPTHFMRRDPGFFAPGRVIQIRNETQKNDSGYATGLCEEVTEAVTTMDDNTDKWFLILKAEKTKAQCLVISTNSGRGVSQLSDKHNYSPVYFGSRKAQTKPGEEPRSDEERMMRDAIPIDLAPGSLPLPEMARIFWTQLHHIPYDTEASFYGTVRRDYEWRVNEEYNRANPNRPWDVDIRPRE